MLAPSFELTILMNGVDIIELGLPFTDPIADGPTIQKSNLKALKNGVTITSMLEMVREARRKGLKTPVLFMGYYNPLLRYGESQILADCKDAGVNGFIIVDLPPEDAIRFRNGCTKMGYVLPSGIGKFQVIGLLTPLTVSPTSH
ncbi:unnamed protein product [Aspergillus oryzae var. brunneus]|uniref:tryptophan synthase n=2 Tax=Aspergillus oryzae TaxID=5062 RepID=A0AAN5BYL3_ASPOZ|nr:unnamed protein product [Aspergillus oryzae]GMG30549.1 unnamed protein product [Aspergillus oryzae]GMG45503.1 unnamed protein product [Aspergillus oryzae var. brunneus]